MDRSGRRAFVGLIMRRESGISTRGARHAGL